MKTHLAILALAAGAAQAQVHVSKPGFFDPTGVNIQPFSLIEAAVCSAPSGGTLNIGPGIYRESLVVSRPMTLQATGLPVTVGQRTAQSTTFRIVSYNTHLFGNDHIPALPRWLDPQRAAMISQVVDDDAADVFGVQEVWDPDFFGPIGQQTFPNGYYGSAVVPGRALNSGLGFYSMLPLQNSAQQAYLSINELSFDGLSSKGYIRTTVTKNGFPIGIFNTHTQSGNASGDISARQLQLQELAAAVILYRTLNPTHPVILVGDFNVPGETSQHWGYMRASMGGNAETKDGFRNLPCSSQPACTSCASNQLHHYFDPEGTDTRLDYVLYAGSLDGSVEIVPSRYERRVFQVPQIFPPLSHDGLTTRDLSDHYGVFMEFELFRQ